MLKICGECFWSLLVKVIGRVLFLSSSVLSLLRVGCVLGFFSRSCMSDGVYCRWVICLFLMILEKGSLVWFVGVVLSFFRSLRFLSMRLLLMLKLIRYVILLMLV